MSGSKVIPKDAKDQFWSVVKKCLTEFHRKSPSWARERISQFFEMLEEKPEQEIELFYHSEPFDVACRLAGHSVSLEKHLRRYLEIRDGQD
jgi:hypothetical protein